ncbi:MAG: hypothetical protein CBB71_14500 [Rhodopirellula sp. TMED11]|nr:MAG: hypothetical protein CBB71_14500 [Rhodopirellula sp. TMED11]
MPSSRRLSRRTILKGAGIGGAAAAVSLPLLEAMKNKAVAAAPESGSGKQTPGRVAYLYIPNGVAGGAWQPEVVDQQGNLRKLNPWMQPLEKHRQDITVFRNLWTPRGNGHIAGTATWLTGGGFDGREINAGGTSVDQIAARHFDGQTLLPSLELSVRGEGIFTSSLPRNAISWANATTPAPRDIEPRIVFDRMFRSGQSGLGDPAVVDLVLEHSKSLKRQLGQSDRHRIDEYLQSVHALEQRIKFAEKQKQRAANLPALQNALRRPEAGIPDDHQAYMQSMMDMIVLAFWSDATRVCTFMMDHGQSNRYFNFIDGVQGTWHALSHWKDISGKTEDDDGMTSWNSRDEKRDMYNRVTRWHTEQVAYLLARLADINEPEGRLLDHSMIVYGSSLADGHEHEARNLPLLLAGGRELSIRQGKQRGQGRASSMSQLHLSILDRLGVPQKRFAEASESMELDS